jgi:M6 family metalloprotease-like protein
MNLPVRNSIRVLLLALLTFPALPLRAADSPELKTPTTAQASRIDALARMAVGEMGFLGVSSDVAAGKLVVTGVAAGSPASKAGVMTDDVIEKLDGQSAATPEALRKLIQSKAPGQTAKLSLARGGKPLEVSAKLASLGAAGRPIERIRLGVSTRPAASNEGEQVESVDADSPGAKAGLKAGDLILHLGDAAIDASVRLKDALANTGTNNVASLTVRRDGKEVQLNASLASLGSPDIPISGRGGNFTARRATGASRPKDALKLALVLIEFPDVKHNASITPKDWEREFFSTKSYTRTATGQAAYGSVNDFYSELSSGLFHVQGKAFEPVQVSRNRLEYSTTGSTAGTGNAGGGNHDSALLREALDKLAAREGASALNDYDALVFLYAGGVAARELTSVYWPHSSTMAYRNRRFRYFIGPEGGRRMSDISMMCHEFGHVLGLPDLYLRRTRPGAAAPQPPQRPANPYAQSLGNWDLMAVQVGGGRPQHMSAWSKERLGWLTPAVIDPTLKQDLVLAAVENTTNQSFKIPVRPDGSEYFLLENRQRIGFDASVPATGLLIWRVVYGRPILEAANGASNVRTDVRNMPFPTAGNTSFTPFTKPSSAALTGSGLPVYLTNIRRLADGKIAFRIGYGFD